jgi:DNA-binding protein YbaB
MSAIALIRTHDGTILPPAASKGRTGHGEEVAVTHHQAEAERLLAGYRRSREQLAAAHRALAALSVSERSQDGAVTVTVGATGTLTDLTIRADVSRHYRPQRLAETILQLTGAAAQRAAAEAAKLLEPVLPPAADPDALLAGTADLQPDELAPPAVDGRDGHRADEPRRSWLQPAQGGDG